MGDNTTLRGGPWSRQGYGVSSTDLCGGGVRGSWAGGGDDTVVRGAGCVLASACVRARGRRWEFCPVLPAGTPTWYQVLEGGSRGRTSRAPSADLVLALSQSTRQTLQPESSFPGK